MEASRPLFTSEAQSFKPLAALRIGLGAVLLVQAYVLWKYRLVLLNPEGPIPWDLSDSLVDPALPKLSDLLPVFTRMGLGAEALVATVLGVHALAAAFLMLGYRTRPAAIFAWLTFVLLKDTSPAFLYGIGSMLLIALFYSVLMPLGREWSLDGKLLKKLPPGRADASFYVLVFRVHVCIIYAFSGISKAAGEQWWSGEALWRALSLPQFSQFDPVVLLGFGPILQGLAVATILTQLAYPILVWTRLRVWIVLAAELLHLGIAVFLGLWLFSLTMILLNTAAFGESVWNAYVRRFRGSSA